MASDCFSLVHIRNHFQKSEVGEKIQRCVTVLALLQADCDYASTDGMQLLVLDHSCVVNVIRDWLAQGPHSPPPHPQPTSDA